MPYVYRHIRLDKNEPFYIGIGASSDGKYVRANEHRKRNNLWNNIVSKTDYRVDILFDDLTWEEACEKEKEFIALYGRKDLKTGILCNMTEGGDGFVGAIFTDEHRKKLSIASRNMSIEARKKISLANKGKKFSDEHKMKLSSSLKGRKMIHTEESRKKISNALIGRKKSKRTEEHNYNFSQATSKLVIDMNTGIYYIGVKNAAQAYNINYNTLMAMLNGNKINKTNLKYI